MKNFKFHSIYFCVLLLFLLSTNNFAVSHKNFDLLKTVKYYIDNDYVKKDVDYTQLEYGAIKGYLKALGDPYTRFMTPKSTAEMKTRLKGSFFGIGIQIGIKKDLLTVISPIIGTPADEAGIKALDVITGIDGVSTKGMGLEEAVSRIRGIKGSRVALSIRRQGVNKIFEVLIVRNKINMLAVDKKETFENSIGYIRLRTFENRKASKEMINALNFLIKQDIKALIFDLRFNGGGLLQNAIEIADMFLSNGAIVHTIDRDNNKITTYAKKKSIFPDKPLVVLVNEGSASASEIVSGALKDNNRADIVGIQTFGKASVQRILNLQDGSSILYTTAKYYTPNLIDISEKGISVDIEIKIPSENSEITKKPGYTYSYKDDYQLQQAIKIALSKI